MSTTQYKTTRGHEPLRVPAGWKDQDRALIIQLERILDDIYKHFQKLRKSDLSQDLLDLLAEYDQAVEDVEDILDDIKQALDKI